MDVIRTVAQKALGRKDGTGKAASGPGPLRRMIESCFGRRDLVLVHKAIVRAFGGDRTTAAMFEQLCFWQGKERDPDGWVYKSAEEWDDELCVSPYEVNRSFGKLRRMGLCERKRKRRPNGTNPYHYRLCEVASEDFLLLAAESERERGRTGVRSRSCPESGVVRLQEYEWRSTPCIDAVLTCSSYMQIRGGSDSQLCTAPIGTAPPHVHTQEPPTLPPIQGAALPEEADEPDPFFSALVEACVIDTRFMATGDAYSRRFGEAIGELREMGAKPEEVRAFGRWWREHFMRNGSPPEIRQVPQNWRRFVHWRKEHQPALRRDAMVVEVAALSCADREAVRERGKAELERVKARLSDEKKVIRRAAAERPRERGDPARGAGAVAAVGGGDPRGRLSAGPPSNGPGPGRARAPAAAGVARAAEALEAGACASAHPGGASGGPPGAGAAEGYASGRRGGGGGGGPEAVG